MDPKSIYLDTSVWNCLFDQGIDPEGLTRSLATCNAALALGFNVMYEMGKLFRTGDEAQKLRGRALLTYMKGYLELRVPIVKENWALLIEEALDVTKRTRMESCFRNEREYRMASDDVDKLILHGSFEPEAAKFFEGRNSLVRESRDVIKDGLDSRPDSKAHLNAVSEHSLSSFLATEAVGPTGERLLLGHLSHEFPNDAPGELRHAARLLLSAPRYRVSRALPRADLYLNWRCARRGSLRADLPDDTFHVISAAYSDIFVTTEADQASIAHHALEGIRTVVCEHNEPVVDRITAVLPQSS
jgi:inactivated superfamily I helicase